MESLSYCQSKAEAERRLEAAARAGKAVDWKRYRQMGLDVQSIQARLVRPAL
jgi:hypothetical protein